MQHRKTNKSILGYPGAQDIPQSIAALELDCDILIPAALENVITADNAPRIKAKIIGEAANGPTTAEADGILKARGVYIIPDFYLNAGGVTVSYFEWLKNLSHVRFGRMQRRFEEQSNLGILNLVQQSTGRAIDQAELDRIAHGASEEDLVNSGLEDSMAVAYHQIRDILLRPKGPTDLRTAAFVSAIDKIAVSYEELGLFP